MLFKQFNLINEFEKIFNLKINKIENLYFDDKVGITGKVNMSNPSIFKFRIYFSDSRNIEVIAKFKSRKIVRNGIKLLNSEKDFSFYYYLILHHNILSFDYNYKREIAIYNNIDDSLKSYIPKVLGTRNNYISDKYIILMEEINSSDKSFSDVIYEIIDTILKFHIKYYNKEEIINKFNLNCYSAKQYKNSRKLFKTMFNKLDNNLFEEELITKAYDFIENIYSYYNLLPNHKTMTHNDFNLRNIFIKDNEIIIYDWELACYQNPEHDLVEFLVFVLHYLSDEEILQILTYFKSAILKEVNKSMSDEDYIKILEFNVLEYLINKLSVYRLASITLNFEFIEDMCRNINRLYFIIKGEMLNE